MARVRNFLLISLLILVLASPSYSLADDNNFTLRIAIPSPPQTLNVWSGTSTWTIMVLDLVYEPLAVISPESRFIPWLAESWQASPDGRTWTIELRKGIKWQDGFPFTAEDVKFTFDYFKKDPTARRGYYDMEYLDRVEVVDNYTVRIHLIKPFVAVVSTMFTDPIVPKHIWEPIVSEKGYVSSKYEPKLSEMVGTGPYKIVEYKTNEYIKLAVNENYWRGAPAVKNIVIQFVGDGDVQVLMIKKGEIDAAIHLAINPAVEKSLKSSGIKVHRYLRPYFYHWGFNLNRFPFNESEFRKAMACAINLSEIVKVARLGAGEIGSYGVIPPVWKDWYCEKAAKMYSYNPDKARSILDKLGWIDRDGDGIRETPDGRKLSFDIYVPSSDPARIRAAGMIREYLKEIGVEAKVRVGDWRGVIWPGIKAHKFDSFLLGSGTWADPDFMRIRFETNASANYYGLSDAELDNLLEEQAITLNSTKRKEIVCKIQERLANILPLITLYYPVIINPYRTDRFEGWVPVKFNWIFNRWTILNLKPKAGASHTLTESFTLSSKAEQRTEEAYTQYNSAIIILFAVLAAAIIAIILWILLRKL